LKFYELRLLVILSGSIFKSSGNYAPRYSHLAYKLACLGIDKNGHVAYRLDASKLVRFFTSAGAPASR
jgi:hypothetical protein